MVAAPLADVVNVVGMLFSAAPIVILSVSSTCTHQRRRIGGARNGQELQPLHLCNPLQPIDGKRLLYLQHDLCQQL